MSDEQQSETTTETGDKWGDPISPERQAVLQRYLDRCKAETDHGERKGPFNNRRRIFTGADVCWLAEQLGSDGVRGVPNLHLEGALVVSAQLKGAHLREAHLEGVYLSGAHLEGADLLRAHLEGANLSLAHLEGADLYEAHLEGADLLGAHLEGATLSSAHLEGRTFREEDPDLLRIRQFSEVPATLTPVDPHGAFFSFSALNAVLRGDVKPSDTFIATGGGEEFPATLPPTDLRSAFFDDATHLDNAILFDTAQMEAITVVDLHWRGVNLAVVDLPPAHRLGDERTAREPKDSDDKLKNRETRIAEFQAAVRANRQLAVALRAQGLNEDADRFAYRAQVLQRQVLRRQRQWLRWLGSGLLDAVAGYGYRPVRSVIAYVLIVCLFAGAYLLNAQFAAPHLTWDESLVLSINSFHGRGFFTTGISLGDTLARLAAGEAIIGLLIEITFIATFTQRFFAR